MSVSRRIFLWKSALTAAACAAIPLEGLGQRRTIPGETTPGQTPGLHGGTATVDPYAALAGLDRDLFTSAVGSNFKIAVPGASPVWLQLLAVSDLPGPPAPDPKTFVTRNKVVPVVGTTGFMLRFATTSPDPLPQDTYTFSHATLGEFVMFIVPEGSHTGEFSAVVNRLNAPMPVAVPVRVVSPAAIPAGSTSGSPNGPALGTNPGSTSGQASGHPSGQTMAPAMAAPASTSSDSGSPSLQSAGTQGGRKAAGKD